MKILFDHPQPFLLAHGGFQIQIEQTKSALEANGVKVEHLRWWDPGQTGDLIHYFGRPSAGYIQSARQKRIKVVMAELLTGLGSRRWPARLAQKAMIQTAQALLPRSFTERMAWKAYRLADACVALTPWEAHLMTTMFSAPQRRVHCVPNGVEPIFLESQPATRDKWLVCTATITARKRVVELAQAAVLARTPLWVVGKPYSDSDPYASRFAQLARHHPQMVRHEGAIDDRAHLARIYREARGFVLLSTMESLSLSALEAAACACPLLLSDLPWARSTFGANAQYCPLTRSASPTARRLREFWEAAPRLPVPKRPLSWSEVAQQFVGLYEKLMTNSP